NTLDHWAGYAPNPDDADRLLEEAAKLGPGAPLLREVGGFAPYLSGDEPLFDLGGNAAEWAVGEDGGGVPLGGSADRPSDPKGHKGPGAEYVGLRVVKGAAPAPATRD